MLQGLMNHPIRTLAITGLTVGGLATLAACGGDNEPGTFVEGAVDASADDGSTPGASLTEAQARLIQSSIDPEDDLDYSDGVRTGNTYTELLETLEDPKLARTYTSSIMQSQLGNRSILLDEAERVYAAGFVDAFDGARAELGDDTSAEIVAEIAQTAEMYDADPGSPSVDDGRAAAKRYAELLQGSDPESAVGALQDEAWKAYYDED